MDQPQPTVLLTITRSQRCLLVDSFLSPLFKVKFGEAADQDSQELFGLISHFVHDFRRTHADLRSGVTAVDQSS